MSKKMRARWVLRSPCDCDGDGAGVGVAMAVCNAVDEHRVPAFPTAVLAHADSVAQTCALQRGESHGSWPTHMKTSRIVHKNSVHRS